MDPGTGRLYRATAEAARTLGLVPVRRELTDEERARGRIRFADPCGCGSGRKFKHCCFLKRRTDSDGESLK